MQTNTRTESKFIFRISTQWKEWTEIVWSSKSSKHGHNAILCCFGINYTCFIRNQTVVILRRAHCYLEHDRGMAASFCPLAHRADWHTRPGQANPLGGCRRDWCNQSGVWVGHGHFFFFACCFHNTFLSIFHCFSKKSYFLIPQIFLCPLIFSWFFSATPVSSLFPCLWILLMQSTFILFHATFIRKKMYNKYFKIQAVLSDWALD